MECPLSRDGGRRLAAVRTANKTEKKKVEEEEEEDEKECPALLSRAVRKREASSAYVRV